VVRGIQQPFPSLSGQHTHKQTLSSSSEHPPPLSLSFYLFSLYYHSYARTKNRIHIYILVSSHLCDSQPLSSMTPYRWRSPWLAELVMKCKAA
ncbi:hypothetical protein M8C21_026598, partial [Ambrosia artemisiifolia]